MSGELTTLEPLAVAQRLRAGAAILVDVREPDEFARRHVRGALSRPLSAFESAHLKIEPSQDVVFACRSGMRTQAHCRRLANAVEGPAYVLKGGIDAWVAAGLPLEEDRKAPLEIIRQVHIAAGLLVLTGMALAMAISPFFLALPVIVGAGLTFSGATGFCGMARLLALAPWNQPPT